MAEYIDRELARQVICGWCEYDTCPGYDYYWDKCDAKRRLDDIPSADVQPIAHGHWVRCKTNIGLYQCSRCNFPEHEQYGILGNYCRNCGAKMEGVRR